MSSEAARYYFDLVAEAGLTKHYGSMEATRELIALCHIGEGQYVLDVGCGVGATPVYLAKTVGCRVVGVDLLEKMVQQSHERARAECVEDRIELRVADARQLPFDDDLFDAVISESVNVFFEDKLEAMREYVRVTKPGGYVGTTEMTWLKPPSAELERLFREAVYAQAHEAHGWTQLLKEAGLKDVVGRAHQIDAALETQGRIERYGRMGMAKAVLRILVTFFKDRRSRGFLKDMVGGVSRDLLQVVGYGVYAGRKE
jgi:ubiquinone/menaquinone biosynthesis C-methylase UbiE